MIKRIAELLAGIFRAELQKTSSDVTGLYTHVTDEITALRKELASIKDELKQHAAANTDKLAKHVSLSLESTDAGLHASVQTEITKQFDKIVTNASVAAKEALADARKTLRMPCGTCGTMSWKFVVTPEGKVLCG